MKKVVHIYKRINDGVSIQNDVQFLQQKTNERKRKKMIDIIYGLCIYTICLCVFVWFFLMMY